MEVGRIPDRAELKVTEAPQSDVGLGRARIDETTRHFLGIDIGGYLEIAGKKSTVASVFPSMPEDEGKELLRIDGFVRQNANASLGDRVGVNKADAHPAEKVTLAPVIHRGHEISFGQGIENFVKRGLLNRPVVKGDLVIVPGIVLAGGATPFMVVFTKPEGIVRIAEETTIALREAPFRESGPLSPEELFRVFTDRVLKSLLGVMEEFGGELSELGGETGERAKSISKKLLEIIEELREKRNRGE